MQRKLPAWDRAEPQARRSRYTVAAAGPGPAFAVRKEYAQRRSLRRTDTFDLLPVRPAAPKSVTRKDTR